MKTGVHRRMFTDPEGPRVMEHFVAPLTRAEADAFVDRIGKPLRQRSVRTVGPPR